ncbi:hypothetical protein J6590_090339 [Homalodisca vitripennis]|nr:hypothetical protein J6590_090339 [Homalodisca vitripennis]
MIILLRLNHLPVSLPDTGTSLTILVCDKEARKRSVEPDAISYLSVYLRTSSNLYRARDWENLCRHKEFQKYFNVCFLHDLLLSASQYIRIEHMIEAVKIAVEEIMVVALQLTEARIFFAEWCINNTATTI